MPVNDIKRDAYLMLFPKEFRWMEEKTKELQGEIYEIRIRNHAPLCIETVNGRYYWCKGNELTRDVKNACFVSDQELQGWLQHLCRHSLYAYKEELTEGYFTVCGGHRVGVVGQVINKTSETENLKYISSINIRVAHEMIGCAEKVLPFLYKNKSFCSTLIVSPPMGGKTTLLRDVIRCISDGVYSEKSLKVGVIDERGEIAACYMGCVQNQLGYHTDVYTNCRKTEGILRLLRSMSPQVIAMDELGKKDELDAVEEAFFHGCKILATMHIRNPKLLFTNPEMRKLFGTQRFERIIAMKEDGGFLSKVYDCSGDELSEIIQSSER